MSGTGYLSENLINQALIFLGVPRMMGSIRNGSKEANIALEIYAPTIEEIFRGAHWNALRRQDLLTLLQDASGTTTQAQTDAGGPVTVGTGTPGMGNWLYEYAWPIDCLKARYVPANYGVLSPVPSNNIVPLNGQLPPTGVPANYANTRTVPAPFMVSQDLIANYTGTPTSWSDLPDLDNAQGQTYNQQVVILTNVQTASLVYTSLVQAPNVWDPLLRQAVVSAMAAKMAMSVIDDKKVAFVMQTRAIANAKAALEQARLADGNEAPGNVRREASWVSARGARGDGGYGGDYGGWGDGITWGSWDSVPFPNGDCF